MPQRYIDTDSFLRLSQKSSRNEMTNVQNYLFKFSSGTIVPINSIYNLASLHARVSLAHDAGLAKLEHTTQQKIRSVPQYLAIRRLPSKGADNTA